MIKKIHIYLFLLAVCVNVYSTKLDVDSLFEFNIDKKVKTFENEINQHIKTINKLLLWTKFLEVNEFDKLKIVSNKIVVNQIVDNDGIQYSAKNTFLIILTHSGEIKRYMSFYNIPQITIDDIKHFDETKKILDKFKKIDENMALESALSFVEKILTEKNKQKTLQEFDSINISYGEYFYEINISCKSRTEVFDSRLIQIVVDARTGEIIKFKGKLFLDYRLDYKPLITKSEAIAIVENVAKKMGKKIHYKSIYIIRDKYRDNRMVWDICIKEDAPNAAYGNQILIDCENGKILLNDLMP